MTQPRADRRAHARQVVVPNRAALDWGSGSTDGGRDARLLDISRGGAGLESRDSPPPGQAVWLRLEAPAPTPWVNATVVRRDGPRRVGVRFEGECPDELMLAATLGISLVF
jgi:hypothetical protein